MPNSVIVVPADARAAARVTRAAGQNAYPMYIRLDRNPVPVIYTEGAEFAIGQGIVLTDGSDPVLFATGVMVSVAQEAALVLKGQYGADAAVIDIHTIKPIDQDMVATYTQKCDFAFTLEEHNIIGGLGSAVAEVMAEYGIGCKLKRLGINDFYPPGGPVDFKRDQLGLSTPKIVQIVTETMDIEQSAHVPT
jgi:transketolase